MIKLLSHSSQSVLCRVQIQDSVMLQCCRQDAQFGWYIVLQTLVKQNKSCTLEVNKYFEILNLNEINTKETYYEEGKNMFFLNGK